MTSIKLPMCSMIFVVYPMILLNFEAIQAAANDVVFLKLKSMSSSNLFVWDSSTDKKLIVSLKPFSSAIVQGRGGLEMSLTSDSDGIREVDKIIFPSYEGLKALYYPKPESDPTNFSNDSDLKFDAAYRSKTGDTWWHYFDEDGPRPEVQYPIWNADFIAQRHLVTSSQGKWFKSEYGNYQSAESVELTLEVVSKSPKVFVIKNFLSDVEVDSLLEIAKDSEMESSRVCEGESNGSGRSSVDRTSSHTWVNRDSSPITESIYRRAADLLRLDERILNEFSNAESLQVVHYNTNQKYEPHFDWTIDIPDSRFISLLLYLTDQKSPDSGGETVFPLAPWVEKNFDLGVTPLFDDPTSEGIKIHPGKGSAVLFYNLLKDGNGDIRSLHGGCKVIDGEKWLANLWVWDRKIPRRNRI